LAPEPALILVIAALALGLRFWGIGFGLPEHVRPDEQYFVQAVRHFDTAATLDPQWYYYPSLYMYINLAVWRGYTIIKFFQGAYTPPDSRLNQPPAYGLEQLRGRAPNMEWLLGRFVTAMFGAATVFIVYILARRHYGVRAAIAAGALLAINGVHVLKSHFYKNDIATTFFTMLALLCMMRLVDGALPSGRATADDRSLPHGRASAWSGTRWDLGAAVATGLATSTNYYGGFLLVPLVVSQFLAQFERPTSGVGPNERLPFESAALWFGAIFRAIGRALLRWETWAMPAVALAVFAATSPYVFIKWPDFLNTFHRMMFADRQALYKTMVDVLHFDDYGFQKGSWLYSLRFNLRYSMGMLLALLSTAGLVHLSIRRRAADWVLLIFVAVHFVMIASGQAVFMRYWLSLVPILAIAAGAVAAGAIERFVPDRPGLRNAVLALAVLIFGFESGWSAVQQDRLLAREDTRVAARAWLADKSKFPGAIVGTPVDWWGNFYPYGKPTLTPPSQYLPVKPDEVRARGIRYILIEDSPLRLYSPPSRPEWDAWLANNATLLQEFSPYNASTQRPDREGGIEPVYDQLDAFYLPIARFKGIARPGPRIRIFGVKR
jgi:hypothetical protein